MLEYSQSFIKEKLSRASGAPLPAPFPRRVPTRFLVEKAESGELLYIGKPSFRLSQWSSKKFRVIEFDRKSIISDSLEIFNYEDTSIKRFMNKALFGVYRPFDLPSPTLFQSRYLAETKQVLSTSSNWAPLLAKLRTMGRPIPARWRFYAPLKTFSVQEWASLSATLWGYVLAPIEQELVLEAAKSAKPVPTKTLEAAVLEKYAKSKAERLNMFKTAYNNPYNMWDEKSVKATKTLPGSKIEV